MSRGKARQQGLHIRRLGYRNIYWGEPLWLHHHCGWKEAEADVPLEGEDLPILWGGLREGRGKKLRDPEHTDVWLWGLEAHYEW